MKWRYNGTTSLEAATLPVESPGRASTARIARSIHCAHVQTGRGLFVACDIGVARSGTLDCSYHASHWWVGTSRTCTINADSRTLGGKPMGVTCTQIDNFTVMATSGSQSLLGDEPPEFGGQGRGFNPFALLMASLGNCTVVTLTGVAREHDIPLEKVVCHVAHKQNKLCYGPNDPGQRSLKITVLTRDIQVWGEISQEQLDQLLYGAEHCPVSNTLEPAVKIRTTIELVGPLTPIRYNETGSIEPPEDWKATAQRLS